MGYPRRQANQIGQKGIAITAQECELLFCGDEDELDLELLEFTQFTRVHSSSRSLRPTVFLKFFPLELLNLYSDLNRTYEFSQQEPRPNK